MEKKVLDIYADYNEEELNLEEFERLSNEEKLHIANNSNDMWVYTLEEFENAFNTELISDLGFIYFV